MYIKQVPLFKEIAPYSTHLDETNKWLKLARMVPWAELDTLYRTYFDPKNRSTTKGCRLILGLFLGQMLMEMSDRKIVEHFHENPYFQYFCGLDSFAIKGKRTVVHPSLLSKRRRRLGPTYMVEFEHKILFHLHKKGLVKGDKLLLDATVFPANITYPNDVKLLNTARDTLCTAILNVKNSLDPSRKIRTYRRGAKRLALQFQKTRRKTKAYIRKTRNQMLRYLKRNIGQLEHLIIEADAWLTSKARPLPLAVFRKINAKLKIAKAIYEQQLDMATTRGKRTANRIVSFHQPDIRPVIRGKEGKHVEFGTKSHVALVDGYAILEHTQFNAYHEGNRLERSVEKHRKLFGKHPKLVLADQLYATRSNRKWLHDHAIEHGFKLIGRPPDILPEDRRRQRRVLKRRQSQRNAIEGLFGHVKNHLNLDKCRWSVPGGSELQVRLGLIAFNLNKAVI